jgi:DNA polymerase III subunit beta
MMTMMEDYMEIRINRDELYKAVAKVQTIIEKRSNMPILSMVLLNVDKSDLHLSATDLEISFQQKIPAEVINPGSVTISGRKLFEILKECKNPRMHIREKENNWVSLTDDQVKYNLACLPAEEYPLFLEPEGVDLMEMDGSVLKEMINKTIFSVTMEEAGFKLSGVFTEKVTQEGKLYLRMVSTDGHRLSLIEKEMSDPQKLKIDVGIMIPKKGMMELNKLASEGGPMHIGFKQNNCVARKENSLVVIRLLESKFPDYNAVIPKKMKSLVKVKRETLLDGMKKMVILTSEAYRGVKISLEKNSIELVSINPDLGDAQERIEVEYKGDRVEAGFNARYFIDVLQAMESEFIDVAFIDNSSPCVIKGKEDIGFLGLIMPMRL